MFRKFVEEFLEDDDSQKRENARLVLAMFDQEKIGVICEEKVKVGDPGVQNGIRVSQVIFGKRALPVFVISQDFNFPDLMESIEGRTGVKVDFLKLDSGTLKQNARNLVAQALDDMVFAIEAAEKTGDEN